LKNKKNIADPVGVKKSVSHSVRKNVKRNPIFAFYQKVEGAFGQLHGILMKEGRFRKELSDSMDEEELDRFFKILNRALETLQYCPNDLWHYKERAKKR